MMRNIPRHVLHQLRSFLRHPIARVVGLTFAADSFMFGSWVTHIPHVKSMLALNDAELGLALFGMPIGLLLMNPFSPRLIARYGLAGVTTASSLLMAVSFAIPVWMPEQWSLMASLFLVGASVAVMNVAMNTCATNIERAEGIYIMSSCHGMWSMGGMLGSGLSALLIRAGVLPEWHMSAVALVVLIFVFRWRTVLRRVPDEQRRNEMSSGTPGFVLPDRELLLMIFVGVCVSLCEGVAFDWSAVYLRDTLGAPAALAALGFTFFSLSMMSMRFTGDVLIPRYGERKLLLFTAGFSALALLVIVISPFPILGMSGFLMLGAGVALGAPILFNAAARVPGYAQGAGLATYATFSFMGFLAGPPVIGWIGEKLGLPWAFSLVGLLTLGVLPVVLKIRNLK